MAYIIDGLRSYIGIENSMYRHISAEQLGAGVLDRLAERTGIDKVDCIIAGNAVGAGGNIARVMSLSTVFGVETPAFTVDMQCGSSLESIALAAAKIDAGQILLLPEDLRVVRLHRKEHIILIIRTMQSLEMNGIRWRSLCRVHTVRLRC